ncbi:YCF48-related protein [Roseivirga echinicomitans]
MRFIFYLLISVLYSSLVNAQNPWRETGGPIGGLGYNVRIHPSNKNIMFVTDVFSGVNKSVDGGASWISSNNGIDFRTGQTDDAIPVFSLTIDPFDPNEIWVGTQGGRGVYKSTDTGETYLSKVNGIAEDDGLTIRNFTIVKIDNVKTVFMSCEYDVGIQGDEFSKVKGILYKSIDGGDNWTKAWEGNSLARWLEAVPSNVNPARLVLATGIFDREAFNTTGDGILISNDNGATWAVSNQGMSSLFVGGMHADPSDLNKIIVGTGNNAELLKGQTGGVYKSIDGGSTWAAKLVNKSAEQPFYKFTAIQFSASNPNIVYAANEAVIMKSEDSGETWKQQTEVGRSWGPPGIIAGVPIEMTVDANDPNTLFINNYGGGVFKSIDAGITWTSLSNGYTGAQMHSVSVSRQDHSVVASIGRSGPFVSSNRGALWKGVQFGVADFPEWYDIAIDPSDDKHLFVSDEHQATIIESKDSGQSWEVVYRHPSSVDPLGVEDRNGARKIAFAPSNPSVVYAGFAFQGIDAGPAVNESNSTIPSGGAGYDGFQGDFQNSYGMVKSTQGGKAGTWEMINNGLGGKLNVTQIRVDPADEKKVFITLRSGGIFKSLDGGDNWTEITNNLPERNLYSLDISKQDPNIMYVGTRFYGIWKTVDGGANWSQVFSPPMTVATNGVNSLFGALEVHPLNASIIMAADWWSGAYLSLDGGVSWNLTNTGLKTKILRDIEFSNDGKFVYAASEGRGVFSMQFTNEALLSPLIEKLNFDTVKVAESRVAKFSMTNYGNAPLIITGFSTDNNAFSVSNPPTQIVAGQTNEVSVDFNPQDEINYAGGLTIHTNLGDFDMELFGKGEYNSCNNSFSISGTNNSVCGSGLSLLDAGSGHDRYQWFKNEVAINGANSQTYEAKESGSYTVRAIDIGVCANTSTPFEFVVNELPGTQITVEGSRLTAPIGAAYQWFKDGVELAGETNRTLQAADAGNYTVKVTTSAGCTQVSEPVTATSILDNKLLKDELVFIYPNPSKGQFKIRFPNPFNEKFQLNLIDERGNSYWSDKKFYGNEVEVNLPNLASGVYLLHISSPKRGAYSIKVLIGDF